jgi:hypothetical protein
MVDFASSLANLADVTAGVVSTATHLEERMAALTFSIKVQKEKGLQALHMSDAAFQACLADNNRIRQKYGLDKVSAGKFTGFDGQDENRSVLSYSNRTDDVFFDAEEGDDSDDSSENYSLHDAAERVVIIDDDSDEGSRPSSSSVLDRHGRSHHVSQNVLTDSNNSLTRASVLKLPNVPEFIDTARASDKNSKKVIRRTNLPTPAASMENISIMGLLRNNVGKDLSTVAMPIALNEPINLLQKLCEELEYSSLLDKAASTIDPVDRLVLIAGFVVSGYSSTIYRAARKPVISFVLT